MQLHEQTQRLILLLIFYLLGPILTLGIIGGIIVRKLPHNARNWERSLSQQTGLHWNIQSVEYRTPNFVRLHNVKILDDTVQQRPIFQTKQIDVRRMTDTPRQKIFPEITTATSPKYTGLTGWLAQTFPSLYSDDSFWQITAPFSVLDFGKYSSEESALLVQNTLQKLLVRFDSLADVPVQLAFEKIAVVSEHSLKKEGDKIENKVDFFHSVQGNIYRTPTEIRSDWAFQIQGISEMDWNHRERLSFVLSLNDTLDISFQSGRQPIPCELAAVFCSAFKHFTSGSFQGGFSVSSRSANNAHTTRFNQVVFRNVPLAPLVRQRTIFAVDGTLAQLELEQAVFGTEGFYAKGHLQVQHGAMESALFNRCIDRFQLSVNPASIVESVLPQIIPFTACVIHFRLQPEGIDFWADQFWKDAFMYYSVDENTPATFIVYLPENRRTVTYHELMSIFAPDTAPVVPLTPGLQSVVPYIPVR